MRIALGSLQQESNSLSPVTSHEDDFDLAVGEAMYEKINVMDLVAEAGAEVVPTLYAHALPGGPLAEADFLRLAGGIVDGVPKDVDGVWLYLHGALYVEGIGSGEEYLLRRLREKLGGGVPVALALDFHANNTDALCDLANVVCGFRTAPHTDQPATERKAMRLLLRCIKEGLLPTPRLCRANVILPGDSVQTALPPLDAIMARAGEMEALPGMLCAQVFNGQPWVDTPYTGPSMVVTHESDTRLALRCAEELAQMYYDARHDFKFLVEALPPDAAIEAAMAAAEPQVFLTDSGDNTTAGAAGDNAFLLNRLIAAGAKDVLLAGIMDEAACAACHAAALGDELTLAVGGGLDEKSERATLTGRLIHKGDVLSYTGGEGGPAATLSCSCGITVIVTARRAAFTSPEIFASIGMDYTRFKIVVVKLGYLFPKLAEKAPRAILALTPGGSTENLSDMGHTRIRRPMYPLDDNFL